MPDARRLRSLAATAALLLGCSSGENPAAPRDVAAPRDSAAPAQKGGAPPPAVAYAPVTPAELLADPDRWSGRAVELVDAWGGLAGRYRPADQPRWLHVRRDPARWAGPSDDLEPRADLQRIQGVFRRDQDHHGHEELVLELHRLTPLPREVPLAVTLETLERAPKELDRRRVELTATYRAGFERSTLGAQVWVDPFSAEVAKQARGFAGRPARIVGRFYSSPRIQRTPRGGLEDSKKGAYGHLAGYRGLLVAESFGAPGAPPVTPAGRAR